MSANSQAGRQGISFYYGVGLGVVAPADVDIGGTGNVMFGVEEDGWALEAIAYSSVEAGTDISTTLDYSVSGNHIGLAYRTIEKNGSWYKLKISNTDMDFDYSDNTPTGTTTGKTYTLGWGMRMSRDSRLEVDYDYYDSDDFSDPVHMLTARYFWGGSEYQGKSFN